MVTQVSTLNFLPEVFRTETNAQFLAATLDQLVAQPDFRRVEGYIGATYGYTVNPTDKYVFEPTKARADYQLDPAVILLKPNTQTAQDFITYPGILDALKNQGAITDNNSRLFENQFYSWDSFTNLDMLVNYSQYYWMPNGPDAVVVSTDQIYTTFGYTVTNALDGFNLEGFTQQNPTLTLLRGGTYTFKIDEAASFWIQGAPGVTGYNTAGQQTRNVLGVTNNGITQGTVTFTVPQQDAQQQYNLPGNNLVNLVSTLPFASINGQTIATVGNIDGVTQLNGSTLMFYNNGDLATQTNFFTISVNSITGIITLTPGTAIPNEQKITATSGTTYVGQTFYRDAATGAIVEIPYLSAILDTLYYQSGTDPLSVGTINLVNSNAANQINITTQILGKTSYTSPNGVTLINGLKIVFQGNVTPASYQNQSYYVAGVGSSIQLLAVNDFLAVETGGEGTYIPWDTTGWDTNVWSQTLYVPVEPDYITIDRNSRDRNAWSRGNRWFNINVINATAQYNGQATTLASNQPQRAQRPIIQFDGNLALYNYGTRFLNFVNLFDTTTTDAFLQVVGKTSYTVDGVPLYAGQTVIFNADVNQSVRQTVYTVSFVPAGTGNTLVIALTPTPQVRWWLNNDTSIYDSEIQAVAVNGDEIYVESGTKYAGTAWQFSRTITATGTTGVWVYSQQKTRINQPPLFDIFDINNNSIGNPLYYPGTTFTGTELFSYTQGTGANDRVLGFPIAYSSASSIGDIEFTVNLNSDTFSYQTTGTNVVTQKINTGYIYDYYVAGVPTQRTGYVTAAAPSVQNQVFEFSVTASGTQTFACDVPVDPTSIWKNTTVYYNSTILQNAQKTEYTVTVDQVAGTTTVTLTGVTTVVGDKITVLLISTVASATAYYEIPSNLQNNPFNTNIAQVTVGDLKNQYSSIFYNAPGVMGQVFGQNNIYNLPPLTKYGTSIIQSSATLVLPGAFLRNPDLNIFNALQYSSDQYYNYKTLLVALTNQNDFSITTTPATMLDTVLYQISTNKTSNSSFFWSDMLPSGNPYVTNTTPAFPLPLTTVTLPLSRVYNYSSSNFYGICVYLNTTNAGEAQQIQLIRGVDYVVSDIAPSLTVNYPISVGDTITINEYNQTYGNYCPNTPTKIGAYKSFVPGVILDQTYTQPTYFILGHDGSYNKLYGTYTNGRLTDFRDQVLLEFETRVYNNLKVSGVIPIPADEVIPGQFRTTDYTYGEIVEIYSSDFLRWVGANRVDYKTQVFNKTNQYTYNYDQSTNILTGQLLQQGYWRGIYQWFYDTSNPAYAPWEMLGFTSEPTWWTDRYGAAPYTSDNTFMWSDIAAGYIWNNGAPYINPLKIRNGLLSVLPVNSAGQLLPPLPVVVENYNSRTFQRDWQVGDQAPTETSYLRSSAWPFDLMKLLALTKPAKFFNLLADLDLYRYNADFDQYLYNERYHLDPRQLQVYGFNETTQQGVSKASYINWVVDYLAQTGTNGTTTVTTALQNLDVRLVYRLAGFSTKQYLDFFIERSTPNTQNASLLIPADSYSVLLYDNVSEEQITYSPIIIQKTDTGWTVYGNSQSNAYFTVAVPEGGSTETLSTNGLSVTVTSSFSATQTTTVAYGTHYYSAQGISQFIKSYGQHLIDQGMIFEYTDNSVTYTWNQIILQYLWWVQQSWVVGSTLLLNPSARMMNINREGLVVQPLTLQQENFILNHNLLPLQNKNLAIVRDNTAFSSQVLNQADSVGFAQFNLASIEHAVVFDNTTSFNDTIYDLVTGLRQQRFILRGYKSGAWNGYLNASGFLLNQDNIEVWSPNLKYPIGSIVIYKGQYWFANQLIEPTTNTQFTATNSNQITQFDSNFVQEQWTPIAYNQIQTGLFPNPSTSAYDSLYYYNTTVPSFSDDADLSAYSLIGYRPRRYLVDAELSQLTQVNVYQQIIQLKGTNLIANAFKNAQLLQGQIDYNLKEIWAIATAKFGATLSSNYVEFLLDQSKLTGNPTIIGFTDSTVTTVSGAQETVNITTDLLGWQEQPTTANILPAYTVPYNDERGLPSAGYVNLNDTKFTAFNLLDLNSNQKNIYTLFRGDIIWVASYRGSWDVFTPQALGVQVTGVTNNLDGTINLIFASAHNLVKYDPVLLFNFDARVDGYYEVQAVVNNTTITVNRTLDTSILRITNTGLMFKLISRRFAQASDQAFSTVPYSEFYAKNSWIDEDNTGQWSVWQCAPVYQQLDLQLSAPLTNTVGTAVAYSSALGYITSDPKNGTLYRIFIDSTGAQQTQSVTVAGSSIGTQLVAIGTTLYASDSTNGRVYVYKLTQNNRLALSTTVNQNNTGAIAVSNDLQWLYVANTAVQVVNIFLLQSNGTYQYVNYIAGPGYAEQFGSSITTSSDGVKIIVSAPLETISTIDNCGSAYVYSRSVERYEAQGQTVFTTSQTIPALKAIVTVNDIVITTGITVASNTVTFATSPAYGSTVAIAYGAYTLVQQLFSPNPVNGGNYATSVATNKFGAQFVIGAPYDVITADNQAGIAGGAYLYVNSGQQYGSVVGQVTGSVSGTIFIDGYRINFNGTIADIVNQINTGTPTNVTASAVNNSLVISTINSSAQTVNDLIDIVGTQASLAALGITLYTNTQTIVNPGLTGLGQFGAQVAIDNNSNTLIVGDATNTAYSETTFDYNAPGESVQNLNNFTIFDNGSTTFVDAFPNSGVVYEYNLLPAANETILNPSQYVFGQYIQTTENINISSHPRFGQSIAINDGVIVVGAPQWYSTGGRAIAFYPDKQSTAWYIEAQPLPIVAINKLNNISIFNNATNNTLAWLDYIDPIQGKLLGAVETNLDFIRSTDPAIYATGLVWGAERVGTTWLNTTNLRILNTNQPDITYNAKHWGQAFPASFADVYTWIASPVPPIQYADIGLVGSFNNYTQSQRLDKSSNSLVTDYYFWVKNYPAVPPGKTLSPQTVSSYLLNPGGSGIQYLAPITTNVVALMNCGTSINANTSALHIGYSTSSSTDQQHTSWTLLQENTPEDFLSGLPTTLTQQPTGLYAQYINSFAGQTPSGTFIPNPQLPVYNRYGVYPNQSMFVNRTVALQNYIDYANSILIKYPIAESKNLFFLEQTGPGYNTPLYWEYVTWWATGYSSATKVIFEVAYYNDLQTIQPNQIIPGTTSIVVGLQNGLIAKVTNNNRGNAEYYVYNTTTGWVRIGLENGTIQILSTLYTTPVGFDSTTYDSGAWAETLSQETYWIIRWLNEQCYTGDLLAERNISMILMFNYITSEAIEQQNFLPWLNKTSLVNVSHKVRELLPYKTYQRDNQEFLQGYLNEVKPFHVKINQFLFTYPGSDTYLGDITDFDLPAKYSVATGLFETPQLVYSNPYNNPDQYLPSDPIWSNGEYVEWFNNYGLSIASDERNYANIQQQFTQAAVLAEAITSSAIVIPLNTVNGLPSSGYVYINAEKIEYSAINYTNSTLYGVVRGVNTVATSHAMYTPVNVILPAVSVLYPGRGYTEPPKVTLIYDTARYPQPRTAASFVSTLANDQLLSITVTNPGSGYPVLPKVVIQGSSIAATFSSANVNISSSTITITAHPFISGDIVTYSSTNTTTVAPKPLVKNEYYYIKSIDANTIALYTTLELATNTNVISTDLAGRVLLSTQGTGNGNQLAVTAKAALSTSSQPIRELNTTVKFDRISYGSNITQWSAGGVYAGPLLDYNTSATFAITGIVSTTGPTILNISYSNTTLSPGQLNHQRVTLYNISSLRTANPVNYYVVALNSTQVALYYDALYTNPVPASVYLAWAAASNIIVLPAPIVVTPSLVTYAGNLYQCLVSNNNVAYFNYNNWQLVPSSSPILTAADRITAFYKPTDNMTGLELRQLIAGITYPNATVLGTPFSEYSYTSTYDTQPYDSTPYSQEIYFDNDATVVAPAFNANLNTNPTTYDIQGGLFTDGYGPEELLPGVVTDELEFYVTTKSSTLPPGQFLNFRISVNQAGQGKVYNTNPYTQTTLSQNFVSTGSISDVIHVTDASVLVSSNTVTVSTNAQGVAIISGVLSQIVAPITITGFTADQFTYKSLPGDRIEITIPSITSVTSITVTTKTGNMLLLANEYIQFTSIDFANNSVTGLSRGRKGTVTNTFVASGTTVQSVLTRDELPDQYYYQWWYNPVYTGWEQTGVPWDNTPGLGWNGAPPQTLEQSTTAAAIFLQNNTA